MCNIYCKFTFKKCLLLYQMASICMLTLKLISKENMQYENINIYL